MPDPDYRQILEDSRSSDSEENARTTPPESELIDLCCLWAVEFYTPSHVDRLIGGFDALGWSKDDDTLARPNPALWVRQLRETAYGGGWFNLGVIYRTGEKRFVGIERTAPLPPHVEYATGEIFSVTSSMTCIVMGFVLDEAYSRRVDQALRRKYQTYPERRQRGYRFHQPSFQKKAALRSIRACTRELAANWFRAHLPGLFSSGTLDGEFPTCEFMKLRVGCPFPEREESAARPEEYLRLLDIAYDWDAWAYRDAPGLKFAWPLLRDEENGFHAIVAVREDDLPDEDLRIYGEVYLLAMLQAEFGGRPIVITSGYRTQATNDQLRAQGLDAPGTSFHILGQATDVQIGGVPPAQVGELGRWLGLGGVGIYETFVHLDTGPERFWRG